MVIAATSALQWITALGSLCAAVAGAVAAVAAWRSAGASQTASADARAASEDAREAVALGIAPTVLVRTGFDGDSFDEGFQYFLEITNGHSPPATDVKVEVRYSDGTVGSFESYEVPPPHITSTRGDPFGPGKLSVSTVPAWKVPIEGVKPVGHGPWGDLTDRVASVVITYWDVRRIAQYQLSIAPITGAVTASGDPINSDYGEVVRIR
jgi:hypothetical protein